MTHWGIDAGLEDRFSTYFPFQHLVPRDPEQNRRYRLKMWAADTEYARRQIRDRCKNDFLYYLMTFVSIFRAKEDPKPVPFIPYDFQFEVFTVLWKCLHDGQEDCRIIKPRDMGVTWLILCLYEHAWHFFPDRQILLGSRKEDEVDGTTDDQGSVAKAGEWSTLFGKLDFLHLKQPSWLLPRGYEPRQRPFRTSMKLANAENGSLFKGESANAKFGRSGRYFAIGFDEHAHTEHAYKIIGACSATSDCHFWFSSPDGPMTAFAMLGRAPIRQIRLEWWMHPEHAEGMTIDPEKGDKSRWSPWLSKAMARIGYDHRLAQNEIWADESQSGGSWFKGELIDLLLNGSSDQPATVREPFLVGDMDIMVSPEQGPWVTRFLPNPAGRWKLWIPLDSEGRPPKNDRYIITADVAAGDTDSSGKGASNSAIVVISELQRAKVAEFATHGVRAHKLAAEFVAVSRFFCGTESHAFMNWDAAGPGGDMGDVITGHGEGDYGITDNIYMRVTSDKGIKPGFVRPGTPESSRKPWGLHEKMLWDGSYIERSAETVDEMRYFNHNPTGGAPIHAASQTKDDPSGARENHGDRTTATVLGVMELANRRGKEKKDDQPPPYGSILHAKQIQRRAEREKQLI